MTALTPTDAGRFCRHLAERFEAYAVDPMRFCETTLDPIVAAYGDPDAPVYALRSGREVHTNTMLCPGCDTPVRGSFCARCDEWVMLPALAGDPRAPAETMPQIAGGR